MYIFFMINLADSSNYAKIYTTLNSSSDGWLTVPSDRAPQQGGYNIIPLNVDLTNKQVAVNFKGTSTASEADWRVSIVSKTRSGETRYSTMWNNGTNTLDLKGDETQVYLVVCATPDNLSDLTSFDENYVGTRYPYSIQVSTNNNISGSTEETPSTTDTPDINTPSLSGNNIASKAKITTSACSSWENANALNDGYDPTSSNDRAHAVYGNWPETGTQWVKYTFDKNYTINGTDIYWFKDGAGIDVPSSYKIKYLDGNSWVEVPNGSGYGKSINKYNSTSFSPITTNSIMIEMNSNGSYSTGILEWKVYGEEAGSVNTPIETPEVDNSDKPALTSGDIKIEAYNSLRNALSNTISPLIKITNTSNEPLDLSKVSLRYYYTADGASSQNYWCDWSSVGSQNVKSKFVTSSLSANADNYLEISFTSGAGTLAPGSTAFINGRISKGDWSNYNQSNDYSFNSSDNSYVESSKIPVYVDGQLIAGVEP